MIPAWHRGWVERVVASGLCLVLGHTFPVQGPRGAGACGRCWAQQAVR